MYMSDYVEQLDRTIQSVGEEILERSGKVSHKKAMEKAYIETLKELKQIENKTKEINERGYD